MDSGFQPRSARRLDAPSFGEGRQTVPAPGPQVLSGQTCHQTVTNGRDDVRVVQVHDARGPRAEVGPQVRHVVPEMCADGRVVVQFREANVSARPGIG